MKRILALSTGLLLYVSAPAFAENNGQGLDAQKHPGHIGYSTGEGDRAGGVPAEHTHEVGNEPTYDYGAGGWGEAVSDTAKANKGLPNAHPSD